MKNFKMLLIAATIASTNMVIAQEKSANTPVKQTTSKDYGTPEERAAKQTERLNASCGLTPDQMAKAKQIYLESDQAIEKSNKENSKDKSKAEAEKNRLLADRRAKIDSILTPEQKKKVDEKAKESKGKDMDAK